MAGFVLHYRGRSAASLSAAQVVAAAAACPARVHAPPPPGPPAPPAPEAKAGGPVPAAQAAAWNRVARLDWALRCDRAIPEADAEGRVEAAGGPAALRQAFALLGAAATAAHPALAVLDEGALWQLLALGQDTTAAAGRSADLLEFLLGEAQALDLPRLLA